MRVRRWALVLGTMATATIMGTSTASAVVLGSYARAETNLNTLDVEFYVTDLTANSLCAQVRTARYVGLSEGSVTINETYLADAQGQTLEGGVLVPQTPVTGLSNGDSYAVASREDCWTTTPTTGISTFKIMVDAGAGSTAYYADMDMTRAAKTRTGFGWSPGSGQVCAGRRVGLSMSVYADTPGWDYQDSMGLSVAFLPAPVEVRIQFKRAGTTQWVTKRTVMTTLADGDAQTRIRVHYTGKWRARFPGAFIDPAQYKPSVSVERRIDVITCV